MTPNIRRRIWCASKYEAQITIERACVLWSNPGEVVFTPFMGIGSETYGAVINGRKAIGVELKTDLLQAGRAQHDESRDWRQRAGTETLT